MKGENSIKLFGNDLQALTTTADKIKSVLATVQGITDLAVFTSLGQPTIQIDIDRARAARYGLAPGDINTTIRTAIGGDNAITRIAQSSRRITQPDAPADVRPRGIAGVVAGQREVDARGWLQCELRMRDRLDVVAVDDDEHDFERAFARRLRGVVEYSNAVPCRR